MITKSASKNVLAYSEGDGMISKNTPAYYEN
jgi:hypothetical protein